jgi:hypothetical protein
VTAGTRERKHGKDGDPPGGYTGAVTDTLERIQRVVDFLEARLPDTVRHVWGRWLPASRYRQVPAPDFELYDPARWDPGTGEGDVDLYVPVADG